MQTSFVMSIPAMCFRMSSSVYFRPRSISVAISTILKLLCWKEETGFPKIWRSLQYLTVRSSIASAMAMAPTTDMRRSRCSFCIM
ncbi:MAG: hypothetical protein A4E73_01760 [Syntrophaceae bacterium PtaU1.Bin231]|nr:MAG: hypothetical protein A4E73_01760 [Syntrophaceae bacterium PtaU1.Bin231]